MLLEQVKGPRREEDGEGDEGDKDPLWAPSPILRVRAAMVTTQLQIQDCQRTLVRYHEKFKTSAGNRSLDGPG